MEPIISVSTAIGWIILNALVFVLSVYVVPSSHANFSNTDKHAILHRIMAVIVACIAQTMTLIIFIGKDSDLTITELLYATISFDAFKNVILTLLLNAVLFMCEISAIYLGKVKKDSLLALDMGTIKDLYIAPMLEEYMYRTINLRILVSSGLSDTAAYIIAPIAFGVSHLHHLYATRNDDVEFNKKLLRRLFQFAFTYVFGLYSGYVLLKTNCLYASIALHSMCNYFGFPHLELAWANDEECSKKDRKIIRIALIGGIIGFFVLIPHIFTFI